MTGENISKLIPVVVLLSLGIIEAIGGLYLKDRRSKNDFTIEVLSLVVLHTLIKPSIFYLFFGLQGVTSLLMKITSLEFLLGGI